MFDPRRMMAACVVVACAVTLSGCTTPTSPQSGDGTLDIRLAAGLSLPEGVTDRFEQQTGVRVTVDDSRSAEQLAAGIHDAQPDLVIGISAANSSGIDGEEGLVSYISPLAGDGAADFALDRSDRLTAVSYDMVCALADASALSTAGIAMPQSLKEVVAHPEHVVMANPSTDSAGLAVLGAIDRQSENPDELSSSLDALSGATLTGTDDEALQASTFGGGAQPIVLASAMRAADIFPESNMQVVTSSCTRRVSYAAIVARSPHVNEARKFIDLLLDDEVQSRIAEQWSALPAQRDAAIPAGYQRFVDDYGATASGADLGVLQNQLPALLEEWRQRTEQ